MSLPLHTIVTLNVPSMSIHTTLMLYTHIYCILFYTLVMLGTRIPDMPFTYHSFATHTHTPSMPLHTKVLQHARIVSMPVYTGRYTHAFPAYRYKLCYLFEVQNGILNQTMLSAYTYVISIM